MRNRPRRRCRRAGARSSCLQFDALEGRLLLATFLVTNTNDTGPGSLRQAILDNNAPSDGNTIVFDIDKGGVQTIRPSTPYPIILNPVTIDGTSQPGYKGSPLIVLNGDGAGSNANGLTFRTRDSTVKGLVINSFAASGISLAYRGGYVITGNYIGTDFTGTRALGNRDGVTIDGTSATIGGSAKGEGNLISGNRESGVFTNGYSGRVQGNYIGTDITGTAVLGNRNGLMFWGLSHSTIGGSAARAGNLISGNREAGVSISSSVLDNLFQGNYIGTDVTGRRALGNQDGMVMHEYHDTVGGVPVGAGNLISGNRGDGVVISGELNSLQGNFIGTDVTGTAPLGNGGNGISLRPQYGSINRIGSAAPGAGNTIAFNGRDGVLVDTGIYNQIWGNAIFSNTQLGIELINGGNLDQLFPDLSLAVSAAGIMTIEGTFQGRPNRTFTLEFFRNTVCNPSGFGEGEESLGYIKVKTDVDGNASFTAVFHVQVPVGQFITATATDSDHDTSEFSACREVTEQAGVSSPGAGRRGTPTTVSPSIEWPVCSADAGLPSFQELTRRANFAGGPGAGSQAFDEPLLAQPVVDLFFSLLGNNLQEGNRRSQSLFCGFEYSRFADALKWNVLRWAFRGTCAGWECFSSGESD